MIKAIILNNFKGNNVVRRLSGFDIYTGQNGIGKTSIIQALALAMQGNIPEEPKKEEDIFNKFSSSTKEMSVGLEMDNFSFERQYEKTTKNKAGGTKEIKIKKDIVLSPSNEERTQKDKENRIEDEMGSFPVMLNFNEFLNLTDGKKREFIYKLVQFDPGSWDKESIMQYLDQKLLTYELKENNESQYDALISVIEEVMGEYKPDKEAHESIISMLEYAKKKTSEWDTSRKEAMAGSKKIAELKNQLQETTRNLKQTKEELEELNNQLVEAEKQKTGEILKEKVRAEREREAQEIEAKIKTLEETDHTKAIEELEEKIKSIDDELLELEEKQISLGTQRAEEIEKQQEKIQELEAKIKILDKEIQELDTQRAEEKGKYIGIKTILDKMKVSNENKKCIIDSKINCNQDWSKLIESYKTDLVQVINDGKEVATKLENKTKEKESLNEEIKKINDSAEQKFKVFEDTLKTIINKKDQAKDSKRASAVILETYKADMSSKDTRLKEHREKLQDLKELPEELRSLVEMELLEKQIEGIKLNIASTKGLIEEKEKTKTTLQNLQSTMIDFEEADMMFLCFKEVANALGQNGLQGKLLKESIEPLQNLIDENLKLMGIDHEFYINTQTDRGKEVFQFGWKVSNDDLEDMEDIEKFEAQVDQINNHRNFDSLSDGQKMMTLVAILTAFIEKADPKVKVLALDNAQDLDKHNLEKVLEGLKKIKHKFHNIIVAGVIDVPECEEYTIWNLDNPQA